MATANYRTIPLEVGASATGGADVDVSATLFVDDKTSQDGDVTLVDVHKAAGKASIRAHKTAGDAKLLLVFIVVPLVGNGEFEVNVELEHPRLPNGKVTIRRKGEVADGNVGRFQKTFRLP